MNAEVNSSCDSVRMAMNQMLCVLLSVLVLGSMAMPSKANDEHSLPNESQLPSMIEDLRITEIMYHPLDVGVLNGDSLEFIELKNTGSASIDLSGVAFTNGISFVFGNGAMVGAGEFIVLAANATAFVNHYGFQPFGDYDGRLDNAGERITLLAGDGTILYSFSYSDNYPWPLGPDGGGFSLVPINESAGLDLSNPDNWRGSQLGGSAGADEPSAIAAPPIFINEALTHTDPPFKDAIELFNPTGAAVDIGGWFISDEKEMPFKFKVPANTEIQSQGYLVFDEDDFNPNPGSLESFALSSFGDAIYLFAADAQENLTGYMRGFAFGGADNGVSFGRVVLSTGQEDFVPQMSETLGRENSGAKIGPVVISELHYNPVIGEDEFVEIINISTQTISLFDQQFPENTWNIEGLGYAFPQGVEIGPESIILVVPIAPSAFRSARGVPDNVAIYGPYPGRLSNSGEIIRLTAPDDPDTDGSVPYFDVDRIEYLDATPWPADADGMGPSMVKINLDGLSNDPGNWLAAQNGGTPGFADLGSVAVDQPVSVLPNIYSEPVYPNPFTHTATIKIVANQPGTVRVRMFDMLGREVARLFDKTVPANTTQEVQIERGNLPAGMYFIQVEGEEQKYTVQPIVIR